ncbi:hypothetical protein KP509_32G017200 [Ceratopteris richardii]|uniref:Transcription termination and cleavage factor C-terminal domain-containing protein n=1 Tax=Ceratopteris richardii TaxID=49495 RepID=A0A8T2QST4_CERRI|nr:hypothetical protein KP509_32G017200 [Ceratopteris richardii]
MMQAQQVQGTAQVQQHGIQPVQAQRAQNFPFPMPAPTQPQTSGRTGPMLIPQQPLPPPPSSLGLPPLNFTMQQRSQPQPPLHLNPPPLPQQLRPMLPPSPPRVAQVTGVQLPLSQLPSVPQMQHATFILQQLSGVPANLLFMGIPPPLPNQPPPQVLQAPRPMGEVGGNGNISMQGGLPTTGGLLPPTSGVISQFGSGIVSEVPPTSSSYTSWNQLAASSEPITVVPSGVPLGTITPQSIGMSMGPSHTMLATSYQQAVVRPASYEGSAVLQSQEYSQPLMQAPPIQQLPTQQVQSQQLPSPQLQSQQLPAQQLQSQQLPSQPQMAGQQPSQQQPQISLEPEQQKALLQQVMNLTPEQINSLPPEQRQQVLDLQQAFHNHII